MRFGVENPIPVTEQDIRKARHDLRGRLNALKLCISALEILESDQERVEFLEMIEQASDKTADAMEKMEAAMGNGAGAG
jgi:hypothetical protein